MLESRGRVSGRRLAPSWSARVAEHEAEDAAGNAEHQAFQERLAQESPRRWNRREADRDFAAAADGADEEETGEIGTGDEQDDGNGEKKGPKQRTGLGDGVPLMEVADNGADAQAGHEGGIVAHGSLGDAVGIVAAPGRGSLRA